MTDWATFHRKQTQQIIKRAVAQLRAQGKHYKATKDGLGIYWTGEDGKRPEPPRGPYKQNEPHNEWPQANR